MRSARLFGAAVVVTLAACTLLSCSGPHAAAPAPSRPVHQVPAQAAPVLQVMPAPYQLPAAVSREVVLPAASPQILTGMRISLAISLILAILSEMIVSTDGLGYFTLLAERTFKVPEMYAGIFTLAIFGYVLNRLFLIGEARLIRWHQESSGRK